MSMDLNAIAPQDILRRPVISEKGYSQNELRKYQFEVHPDATKIDIKRAIEKIYRVKVTRVNVQVQHGKNRRFRFRTGRTSEWKKAIVTLREGDHIDFFERV